MSVLVRKTMSDGAKYKTYLKSLRIRAARAQENTQEGNRPSLNERASHASHSCSAEQPHSPLRPWRPRSLPPCFAALPFFAMASNLRTSGTTRISGTDLRASSSVRSQTKSSSGSGAALSGSGKTPAVRHLHL